MKKFNFKALLVVVLAILMVAALVACNPKSSDDNNKPKPEPEVTFTAAEYFGELWDLSKGIGEETIGANDNVAVNAELELELGTKGTGVRFQDNKYSSLKLDIDLGLVLDRQSKDKDGNYLGTNSALKLGIKLGTIDSDTTTINKEVTNNVVSLYYFVNDPDYIYIDFAGKNVKLPFVLGVESGAEVPEAEKTDTVNHHVGEYLLQLLMMDLDPDPNAATVINNYINSITSSMGDNWSLNALVNTVLDVAGLDLKALLHSDAIPGAVANMLPSLGLSDDVIFDENGKVDLLAVLQNETLSNLISAGVSKNELSGGETEYVLALDSLLSLLGSAVTGLDSLLGTGSSIKLSFTEKNGTFKDGVNIYALLNSSKTRFERAEDGVTVAPYVNLKIKHLNFKNATGKDAATLFNVNKAQYKTDIAVEIEEKVAIKGMRIDTTPWAEEGQGGQYDLGEVVLHVEGKLDLSCAEGTSPLDAYAYIGYTSNKTGATLGKIIEASYHGSTLALKVDRTAGITYTQGDTEGTLSVIDGLVNLLGPTIFDLIKDNFFNGAVEEGSALALFEDAFFADDTHKTVKESFQGAIWSNLDIKGPFTTWGKGLKGQADAWLDSVRTPKEAEGEGSAETDMMSKIAGTIKLVFKYLDAHDGMITIGVPSLLECVSDFGNLFTTNQWSEQASLNNVIGTLTDIVTQGSEYLRLGYYTLCLMINNNQLIKSKKAGDAGLQIPLPFEGVAIRTKETAFTLKEVADYIFEGAYGHKYDAKTCVDGETDHAHARCAANYGTATSVAGFFFNNGNPTLAKAFDALTYSFIGNLFEAMEKEEAGLQQYQSVLRLIPALSSGGDILDILKSAFVDFPNDVAQYFFTHYNENNKNHHVYNAETCEKACTDYINGIKLDAAAFVLIFNLEMMFTGEHDAIVKDEPKPEVEAGDAAVAAAESGGLGDLFGEDFQLDSINNLFDIVGVDTLYGILVNVANTFLIEGVQYTDDETKAPVDKAVDVVTYLVNNLMKQMPIEIKLGFEEDGSNTFSITIGFVTDEEHPEGRVQLVLSHHMALKDATSASIKDVVQDLLADYGDQIDLDKLDPKDALNYGFFYWK